jgi:hypothetical protein
VDIATPPVHHARMEYRLQDAYAPLPSADARGVTLDAASAAVLAWWRRVRREAGRLPGTADLDAPELRPLAPNMFVAEPAPAGGFSLSRLLGGTPAADAARCASLERRWPEIAEVFRTVLEEGVPVLAREDLDGDGPRVLEVLHLPISRAGGAADAVLAVFACEAPDAPLWTRGARASA